MKVFRVISIVLRLTLLSGCNGGYQYVENGDESYVVLKSLFTDVFTNDKIVTGSVEFASVSEMKTDILDGCFTKDEMLVIKCFDKNENGAVHVCSVESLLEPTLPSIYELDYISWRGKSYSFVLKAKSMADKPFLAYMEPIEPETMDAELQEKFYRKRWGNRVTGTDVDAERNGKIIYFLDEYDAENKAIVYSIEHDRTTLYVVETYFSTHSDSIPAKIRLWGNANGECFYVHIDVPATRLGMDELKAFGVKEYGKTTTE